MNIPTATVVVAITHRGLPVNTVGGEASSFERTYYMKDKFKELLGDGSARVSVGVDEKFNGPSGTYSSVSLRVNVTLTCDQAEKVIDKAAEEALNVGLGFLDKHASTATSMLLSHLEAIEQSQRERG